MKLKIANEKDANEILSLYDSVRGKVYCVWNDNYPVMEEIENDLRSKGLFILKVGDKIAGAGSIYPENEMDGEIGFRISDATEIGRIVISPEYQGRGLAKILVSELTEEVKKRGTKAVHLAVEINNIPAVKTYKSLGFAFVGNMTAYGHDYYLCEKEINN